MANSRMKDYYDLWIISQAFEIDQPRLAEAISAISGFQAAVFQFADIVITAGLIAGGSATIHQLMALIDDFLKASRKRAKAE